MAQAPQNVQLSPEDFDKKDQGLVSRLATILNSFFESVAQALNRSLTFGENFAGETKELTVTGGQSITFRYSGGGTPQYLFIGGFRNTTTPTEVLTSAVSLPQWSYDGRGSITIQSIPGLTSGHKYLIKFIITRG